MAVPALAIDECMALVHRDRDTGTLLADDHAVVPHLRVFITEILEDSCLEGWHQLGIDANSPIPRPASAEAAIEAEILAHVATVPVARQALLMPGGEGFIPEVEVVQRCAVARLIVQGGDEALAVIHDRQPTVTGIGAPMQSSAGNLRNPAIASARDETSAAVSDRC